ncbi:hypothetical protein GCM10027610_022160 [Dactylosporangium cerinum]
MFSDRHLARMKEIMLAVCADFETELVEFNGENNHVHLLVNFPPKVALAKLVNSLKGVSSRRMRQEFPDLVRHYYRADKTLVRLVPRGLRGRGTVERGASVHRAAEPPGLKYCSSLDGSPSAGLRPRPEGRSTGPQSGSLMPPG